MQTSKEMEQGKGVEENIEKVDSYKKWLNRRLSHKMRQKREDVNCQEKSVAKIMVK